MFVLIKTILQTIQHVCYSFQFHLIFAFADQFSLILILSQCELSELQTNCLCLVKEYCIFLCCKLYLKNIHLDTNLNDTHLDPGACNEIILFHHGSRKETVILQVMCFRKKISLLSLRFWNRYSRWLICMTFRG